MTDAEQQIKTQVLNRPLVTAPSAPPGVLRCVDTSVLKDDSGTQIVLEGSRITIGRGSENDVELNADGISRHHARLIAGDGAWQIEDLGSTNGTRVNNSRIEGTHALADGDTVAFGRVCYKFSVRERAETTGSHDIDLGGHDQTMVMHPGGPKAAATRSATSNEVTARLQTGTHARPKTGPADTGARRKPAAPAKADSNVGLWVVVVVVAVAIAAGAAFALGLV